jgi:hypothetical protein
MMCANTQGHYAIPVLLHDGSPVMCCICMPTAQELRGSNPTSCMQYIPLVALLVLHAYYAEGKASQYLIRWQLMTAPIA